MITCRTICPNCEDKATWYADGQVTICDNPICVGMNDIKSLKYGILTAEQIKEIQDKGYLEVKQ